VKSLKRMPWGWDHPNSYQACDSCISKLYGKFSETDWANFINSCLFVVQFLIPINFPVIPARFFFSLFSVLVYSLSHLLLDCVR
jgi:hypothetical protein